MHRYTKVMKLPIVVSLSIAIVLFTYALALAQGPIPYDSQELSEENDLFPHDRPGFGPPGHPPGRFGRPDFNRLRQYAARQQPDQHTLSALSPEQKRLRLIVM
jgi:hypothetical protein